MTDSLTQSDIDRIYDRLQQDIDLTSVTSTQDLFQQVSSSKKNKYWNNNLNDEMWNRFHPEDIKEEEEEKEEPSPYVMTTRKKRYKKEGYSVRQVRITSKERKRWDNQDIEKAKVLRKNGLTYKQIGTQLNRSPNAVSTKFSRLKKKK